MPFSLGRMLMPCSGFPLLIPKILLQAPFLFTNPDQVVFLRGQNLLEASFFKAKTPRASISMILCTLLGYAK
jgi:hypothetical protein